VSHGPAKSRDSAAFSSNQQQTSDPETSDPEAAIDDPATLVQVAFALHRRAKAAGALMKLGVALTTAQKEVDAAEAELAKADRTLQHAQDVVTAGGPSEAQFTRAKHESEVLLRYGEDVAPGVPGPPGIASPAKRAITSQQRAINPYCAGASTACLPAVQAGEDAMEVRNDPVPSCAPLTTAQEQAAAGNTLARKASSAIYKWKSAPNSLRQRVSSISITGSSSSGGGSCDGGGSARWLSTSDLKRSTEAQLDEKASILGYKLLYGLRINADVILDELRIEASRVRHLQAEKLEVLVSAESALNARRDIDARLLLLLDRFYSRLPGWEDNHVSRMLVDELVDMSESGIEIEHDMREQQVLVLHMQHALLDHSKCTEYLSACLLMLQSASKNLDDAKIANVIDVVGHGSNAYTAASVTQRKLASARFAANEAAAKAKLVSLCCPDMTLAPQIFDTTNRLESSIQADISFYSAGFDVITRRMIIEAQALSRSASLDVQCGLRWVAARIQMIKRDVEQANAEIEILLSDVVEERIALLHQHHVENKGYDLGALELLVVEQRYAAANAAVSAAVTAGDASEMP
jgi:hypothetical protein